MALIKSLRGFTPKIGNNCYLAENATIIGDVEIGDNCSVWFNTVIRGDVNKIRIGNNVNIQDGSVLHCLFKRSEIHIGDFVTIGHNAIIHGATISNYVLVGMGAILMDYSIIEENSIIAAGALVLENTRVLTGNVFGGVPAKKIKDVSPEQANRIIKRSADNYLTYAEWYKI